MQSYAPKKLIEGFVLGRQFAGKRMVAVPEKKLVSSHCFIQFKDETMIVNKEEAVEKLEFTDKFKKGLTYWLYYFTWNPVNVQMRIL